MLRKLLTPYRLETVVHAIQVSGLNWKTPPRYSAACAAANCARRRHSEHIIKGAEELGIPLDEQINFSIGAMKRVPPLRGWRARVFLVTILHDLKLRQIVGERFPAAYL